MREGAPANDGRTDLARSHRKGVDGADEGVEYEDGAELLPQGMADLRKAMTMEGSAAFRFADTVDPSVWNDEWADHL